MRRAALEQLLVRWEGHRVTLIMEPIEALLQVGLEEGPQLRTHRAPQQGAP